MVNHGSCVPTYYCSILYETWNKSNVLCVIHFRFDAFSSRFSNIFFALCNLQENAADAWEVLPNTREGLEALRAKGLRLGIVSNFDSTLACTLRAHDLDKYFDFAVTSEELGTSKPDPAIFHKALSEFTGGALYPGEVAHVGDEVLNDYTAPRNIGMTSFLIDHEGQLTSAVMQRIVDPRHVVHSLKDLDKLVNGTPV